mgnify:CR=1 FL=1
MMLRSTLLLLLLAGLAFSCTEENVDTPMKSNATRLGFQRSLQQRFIPQLQTSEQLRAWYAGLGLQCA